MAELPVEGVMPATDTQYELLFPIGGLHEGMEYQQQPGATTAEALNVRTRDPRTLRDRGASRPGLSRFVPVVVLQLDEAVQHLNVLVNTGPAFLLGCYTVPSEQFDVDFELDAASGSRNPGWVTPIGGSGVQPNRNNSNLDPTEDDEPKWFGGNVVSGNGSGGYAVSFIGGGSYSNVSTVNGNPNLPANAGVLVLRSSSSSYLMQPQTWG